MADSAMNKGRNIDLKFLELVKYLPYRIYTRNEAAFLLRMHPKKLRTIETEGVVTPFRNRKGRVFYSDRDIVKVLRHEYPSIKDKKYLDRVRRMAQVQTCFRVRKKRMLKEINDRCEAQEEIDDEEV